MIDFSVVHGLSIFWVWLAVTLNQILLNFILEPLVKNGDIGGVLFLLCVSRVNSYVESGVDGHLGRLEVFAVKSVERNGRDRGIRITILVSRVGNETCYVFFKLGQIRSNITLSKYGMLVVRHCCGDSRIEVGLLEVKLQVLTKKLQFLEFLLLIINLGCGGYNFLSQLLVLDIHSFNLVSQILLVHLRHLFVHGNLLIVVAIRLIQLIIFLIQLVYIVEELHVLFLRFNESSNDFIDVVDASGFHDSLKRLLDNLSIAYVLIKKSLFLQVLIHY